jgi:DNA-binding transcriptional MerR regulator
MASYRISQLAGIAGVPATTLRFYESAGLLPARRTAAGYRSYDDAAVGRLAFIRAAKLLGLALADIAALLDVWQDGACADVRARLVPLIDERIADAERRGAELAAFSAGLRAAKSDLAGPAPAGGCGPDCGCPSGAHSLAAPVSCSLTGPQKAIRAGQWQGLMTRCTGREQIPDGVLLTFPFTVELAREIAGLAAAELECCAFFEFTVRLSPSAVVVSVRGPRDAQDLLSSMFETGVAGQVRR